MDYTVKSGSDPGPEDSGGSGGWMKYAAIGAVILIIALIGLSRIKR
jgi:hypothetical protein